MQSLQCQQLELECITSLGEEILTTCHPDSIITIKSWVTVAKSRFQEVRQVPCSYPCPGEKSGRHGPTPLPLPYTSPTTRDCLVQPPQLVHCGELGVLGPRGSWPCQCPLHAPPSCGLTGAHLGPPQPPLDGGGSFLCNGSHHAAEAGKPGSSVPGTLTPDPTPTGAQGLPGLWVCR